MKKKFEAVVVGGGIAGLTSAAYLCRYGLRTLLCEKRPKTGGLVETFWRQGFAFDAGIRALENSGIVFPMLKDLGIDIDFAQDQVSIGIGDHSVKLASPDSLDSYIAMLAEIFPDNAADLTAIKAEIRQAMDYMDVLYGIDNPLFKAKMEPDYLLKTLLPWYLKYQQNIRKASRLDEPIRPYLHRFTPNRALIDMIIQHFFRDTPTFFALSYFSLYLDYSYPMGGTGVIPAKMTEYIQAGGGEVLTGAGVVQVNARDHEVEMENGDVIEYRSLIWAADQRTLYNVTTGIDTPSFQKQQRLSQNSKGGDSVLTVFLAVDQDQSYFRDRCGAHMFYTPNPMGLSSLPDWEEMASRGSHAIFQWLDHYLERTTYEISCPVLRDKTLAPAGQTGLIVSTLFDYRLVKLIADQGDYQPFKEACTHQMISVLEKSLFPGLQEMILFSLCATPLTMEKETHNSEGALTGWSFTNPELPSEHRFRKIAKAVHTPIPDVYQCGQWTFSPSGLPISILTGKLAADQVKKKRK